MIGRQRHFWCDHFVSVSLCPCGHGSGFVCLSGSVSVAPCVCACVWVSIYACARACCLRTPEYTHGSVCTRARSGFFKRCTELCRVHATVVKVFVLLCLSQDRLLHAALLSMRPRFGAGCSTKNRGSAACLLNKMTPVKAFVPPPPEFSSIAAQATKRCVERLHRYSCSV